MIINNSGARGLQEPGGQQASTTDGAHSQHAEQECVNEFLSKTASKEIFSKVEFEVLKEVSLWACAMKISDKNKLSLLLQMVKLKPVDEYRYQELVRLYFTSV